MYQEELGRWGRRPRNRNRRARYSGRYAARRAFIRWLRKSQPRIYKTVKLRLQRRHMGDMAGFWGDLLTTVKDVAPVIVQTRAQDRILRAQLKRAERGLPPLQTAEIAPTVRVQTEIGPETRAAVQQTANEGMQKLMLPLAIGGVGLLAVMMMRKK